MLQHYRLQLDAPLQGAQFQTEVFEKVERPYMLGLRSSSQDMRRQFFQIYNKTIPTPLFDRLHFLVCTQSWEKLAGTFWLKEALVKATSKTILGKHPPRKNCGTENC